MKKMIIAAAIVTLSMNACFAMKYHCEIQESDFNTLMIRDEESLLKRHTDQFDYYPKFKALVEAIYNKDEKSALELIAVMTQEELNVQDYVRSTPLIIAISEGQETIALALVYAMDLKGLLLREDEGLDALAYAYNCDMPTVLQAIEQKLKS